MLALLCLTLGVCVCVPVCVCLCLCGVSRRPFLRRQDSIHVRYTHVQHPSLPHLQDDVCPTTALRAKTRSLQDLRHLWALETCLRVQVESFDFMGVATSNTIQHVKHYLATWKAPYISRHVVEKATIGQTWTSQCRLDKNQDRADRNRKPPQAPRDRAYNPLDWYLTAPPISSLHSKSVSLVMHMFFFVSAIFATQ